MPLKPFQQNYWMFSDTTVPPLRITQGGYPGWQASVVASVFGTLWQQAGEYLQRWRWVVRLVRRIRALSADREQVLLRALDVLEHPAYPSAQIAVRETATTLGFHDPQAWKPYSQMLKADPGRADNVFRHVRACERTRAIAASTLTNPTANLLVELAYQDFALRGR
jgi:hypothetical protein